jgi:hypothetical protein
MAAIISLIVNSLAADRAGLAAPAECFPGRRVRDGSGNITTRFYSLTIMIKKTTTRIRHVG